MLLTTHMRCFRNEDKKLRKKKTKNSFVASKNDCNVKYVEKGMICFSNLSEIQKVQNAASVIVD